jgi:hypothetical protein
MRIFEIFSGAALFSSWDVFLGLVCMCGVQLAHLQYLSSGGWASYTWEFSHLRLEGGQEYSRVMCKDGPAQEPEA